MVPIMVMVKSMIGVGASRMPRCWSCVMFICKSTTKPLKDI